MPEMEFFRSFGTNKTEFQPTLELKGSLNSIMRIKMALPELCKCHDVSQHMTCFDDANGPPSWSTKDTV